MAVSTLERPLPPALLLTQPQFCEVPFRSFFLVNLGHKLIYLPKFNILACLFYYFTTLYHLEILHISELSNMVMVYGVPPALVRRHPSKRQNILRHITTHLSGSEFSEFGVGMWNVIAPAVLYSEYANCRQPRIKSSSLKTFCASSKGSSLASTPFYLVHTLSVSFQLI
jgi:hypothetical protein